MIFGASINMRWRTIQGYKKVLSLGLIILETKSLFELSFANYDYSVTFDLICNNYEKPGF